MAQDQLMKCLFMIIKTILNKVMEKTNFSNILFVYRKKLICVYIYIAQQHLLLLANFTFSPIHYPILAFELFRKKSYLEFHESSILVQMVL